MTIETMHVGMVIGRGGDTLRRIERETGARVQFAPGKPGNSHPLTTIQNLRADQECASPTFLALRRKSMQLGLQLKL